MRYYTVFCVSILFALLPFSVKAEGGDKSAESDKNLVETPITALEETTSNILKELNENEVKQFSAINNSFGIIRSVEDVQRSISEAVRSCSSAHPDLKAQISTGFESWKETLRPVMREARKKLDKMVLLQSFARPSDVRAYLKKFDQAVIYRNQKLNSVPIQKMDDCQKLESSMKRTQQDLVKLLTETLALDSDIKGKE